MLPRRTKGEAGTGDVVHAVKHIRQIVRISENHNRNWQIASGVSVLGRAEWTGRPRTPSIASSIVQFLVVPLPGTASCASCKS